MWHSDLWILCLLYNMQVLFIWKIILLLVQFNFGRFIFFKKKPKTLFNIFFVLISRNLNQFLIGLNVLKVTYTFHECTTLFSWLYASIWFLLVFLDVFIAMWCLFNMCLWWFIRTIKKYHLYPHLLLLYRHHLC